MAKTVASKGHSSFVKHFLRELRRGKSIVTYMSGNNTDINLHFIYNVYASLYYENMTMKQSAVL